MPRPRDHSCCGAPHSHSSRRDSCCACGGDAPARLAVAALSLAASFCISRFGFAFPFFPYSDPAWLAVFLCSGQIFASAFRALFFGRTINVSMLVSAAMLAAFALQIMSVFGAGADCGHGSFIFVAGEIAFLMSLGGWLESRTVAKTKTALSKIAALMPKTARVRRGGGFAEIPAASISAGDVVCVNPSEMIPADGVIIKGATSVDQSNITGESLPVDLAEGDAVLCGTFNLASYIEIRAAKAGSETVLTKMIRLVSEAEGRNAPISRAANRWASFVVPCAMALSVLTFFFARHCLGVPIAESLVRAATILVVFCPCAFVLATPTAISAGIGNASKHGILVNSGEALENFSKTTAVFFDKTGTLTSGDISVARFDCDPLARREALKCAAALELASPHPLARALVAYAKAEIGGDFPQAENAAFADGELSGDAFGRHVKIRKSSARSAAYSASEIIIDGEVRAHVFFSDTVRPSARKAVERLLSKNIKVSILSGDNPAAVESAARRAGIENFSAGLLPQDKLAAISAAKAAGEFVCMAGDGVNDAPSLAAADTSVAVAGQKNDVAINAARVSILGGDLLKIPALVDFSKSVLNTITANIAFALAVNAAAVVLGAFGAISPAGGALLHNITSVAVVANSARLLNKKIS